MKKQGLWHVAAGGTCGRARAVVAAAALLLSTPACGQNNPAKVEQLWENTCASCHGGRLQGGSAGSLLDDVWHTGPGDADWFEIIKFGDNTVGMEAFGRSLSDAQVRSLIIYIHEQRDGHAQRQSPAPRPGADDVYDSRHHRFGAKTVVEGLDTPWSMAVLPDGRWLVAEKPGRLRIVDTDGTLRDTAVSGVPEVWDAGQGGLLEVALHPDYADNGWLYLAFSDKLERDGETVSMTKIVRAQLRGEALTRLETIYQADPAHYMPTRHHYGTRLVFDDGYLFFPIGERGRQDMAQDLTVPNGKVHRVFDDGRVPDDNPFTDPDAFPGALPTIWTYGNRNPQGLAMHPATGQLWETEHGPRGGDELNLITPGVNYGWPVITYGMNYNGTPVTDQTAAPGMAQPVHHWTPSIAVCGIDFYTGDAFPRWRNDLFVTALARQELRRLRLDGERVVEEEVLIKDRGRVRDVHTGPAGEVFILFNGPDRIVRLTPAE